MTNDELKQLAERRHFERFCEAAELRLIEGSIQQHKPPAPDIVAEFEGTGRVAFELVRLDDDDRLTRLRLMQQMPGFLQQQFDALPVVQRDTLAAQYADGHITIDFNGAASLAERRKALPFVWDQLARQSAGFTGKVDLYGKNSHPTISLIYVSRIKTGGRPHFRSQTVGFTLPIVVDRIGEKLEKRYECHGPLELLAYVESGEMAHANDAERIAAVVSARLEASQFRRVWVFEGLLGQVGMTLP